jgi:hypothetical protein
LFFALTIVVKWRHKVDSLIVWFGFESRIVIGLEITPEACCRISVRPEAAASIGGRRLLIAPPLYYFAAGSICPDHVTRFLKPEACCRISVRPEAAASITRSSLQ